ncbi:O-antigen ligase family protein [Phascolarctobacterium sp.]|uniref:O-antigen ligase family protein n=1 Tax=Phascolarctobacterium sp. TaxID=2049039 RepID=UPI00386436D4
MKDIAIIVLSAGVISAESFVIALGALLSLWVFLVNGRSINSNGPEWKYCYIIPCVVFFGVLILVSIFNNNYAGVKEVIKWLDRLIPACLLLFFYKDTEDIFKPLFIGTVGGAMYVSGTVICEYLHTGVRNGGCYGNPNNFGGLVIFILPFILLTGYRLFRKNKIGVLVSVISGFVLLLCFFIASSRGAMIGLLAEAVIFLGIVNRKHINWKVLLGIAIAGACAATILLKMQRSYDMQRWYGWMSSWNMFCDNPLLGIGLKNFGKTYMNDYMLSGAYEKLQHPHNIFLFYLAETGMAGFAAYVYMIYKHFITSFRRFVTSTRINSWRNDYLLCFVAVLGGMLVHGMVDVVCNNRDMMTIYFYAAAIAAKACVWLEKEGVRESD